MTVPNRIDLREISAADVHLDADLTAQLARGQRDTTTQTAGTSPLVAHDDRNVGDNSS